LEKGDLTNSEINQILSQFEADKKTVFNSDYADKLYEEYKNNQIDDSDAWSEIKRNLSGKNVLVLAPGSTINTCRESITSYIADNKPIVIGANFIPDGIDVDYAFFSNNKRFSKIEQHNCKIIVTSNLTEGNPDYRINYNSVSGAFNQGCNSLIMLLKMLKNLRVADISMAGADGYKVEGDNYYSDTIKSSAVHDNNYNLAVKNAIYNLGLNIRYITPSEYNN
jgi:4-hydroxy 2-oxovalerate aldolase